jgi:hypothetical protein
MAAAKHIELPAVVVPSHLWMRSARPVQGRIVQFALSGALILAGLLVSGTALRVGLVLAGIGVFLLLPTLVTGRLERLGFAIQAADRNGAAELLRSLRNRPVVQFFAPHAWLTLQEGVLQLKVGDGKAAAVNFVETARLMHQPDAVMLLSAQAHALVVGGERAEARELLQRLAKENLIGPRDQLDLGIVLLTESKKNKQALAYIEAARKSIGEHPRVLAAMALALQKTERIDEASELLEQVQISLQGGEADPVVEDLVKRARKGLQAFIEAQLRRERRSRSRRTTIVVSSDLAASEIVSGEIGAGDLAQLDNPTTSFRPAGEASVISSKSVDGELTREERTMLNIPEQRSRKGKGAGKSESNSFSIEEDGPDEDGPDEDSSDEDSSDEDSAPQPKAPPVPAPVAAPTLVDSVLTALTAEPAGAAATAMVNPSLVNPSLVNPSLVNPSLVNPSLINPAMTASPAVVDPSKVLKSLPSLVPDLPPARPSVEVDVPVFRRKQTLIGVAAVPDVPLGNLPTGGHGPGLPTRGVRPEQPGTFMPPGSATPKFRAPTIGKLEDKGDEGDGSGV